MFALRMDFGRCKSNAPNTPAIKKAIIIKLFFIGFKIKQINDIRNKNTSDYGSRRNNNCIKPDVSNVIDYCFVGADGNSEKE